MNQKTVPGTSLGKFLTLISPGPEWIKTLELAAFVNGVRNSSDLFHVIWDDDYCFFLPDDSHIHGCFKSWTDLFALSEIAKGKKHIAFGIKPEIPDQGMLIREGNVLRRAGTSALPIPTVTDVKSDEVLKIIADRNPEFMSHWYAHEVEDSIREKSCYIKRDSRGEITYLHLMKRKDDYFRGVYFSSTLPFAETLKEFYIAHGLAETMEVRTLVMSDNPASLNLHRLLGYEETGDKKYYCELSLL